MLLAMYVKYCIFTIGLILIITAREVWSFCPTNCKCSELSTACTRLGLTNIPKVSQTTGIFDLRLNLISSIQSGSFSYDNRIKTLYLNLNRLDSIEADSLNGLDYLEDLFLHSNQIEKVHPNAFNSLRRIRNIYLHQNRIKRLESVTFQGLNYLEKLFLSYNKLTSLPEDLVSTTNALKNIQLEGNQFNCDCNLQWLWKLSSKVRINAVCHLPASHSNKLLSSLKQDDFNCNQQKQNESADQFVKTLALIESPSNTSVLEGTNAEFRCRSNDLNSQTFWLKNNNVLKNDGRYLIDDNGSLQIKNVRVEDEDYYTCSVSNSVDIKTAQAYLNVNVPVTFIRKLYDQIITEGNPAEFLCSVSAKPSPKIVWKKDGVLIDEASELPNYEFYNDNQLFRINKVEKTNEGVYSCMANNQVNSVSSLARLIVTESVMPYFQIKQQNISVFEDQSIRLECFAQGDPKPQVSWYRNGQRISTDLRVNFDSYGYLIISQVRVSDAGEYICKADNTAGSVTHSFFLSVKDIHGTIISNTIIEVAIQTAREDVNKQYQNTLNKLNDKRKPKSLGDLMALLRLPKDKTLSLAVSEEIYERALDIVFRYANNITFNLTKDDFVLEEVLSNRQLRRISELSGCHQYKRRVKCSERCLKYRTFDGTCNNLKKPRMGAANTALRRLLPAEYENGFSTPRGWNKSQLYNGFMLPNPRDVSTHIISTKTITNDNEFTLMLMQWGQFLDHDLDHTAQAMSLNTFSNGIACRDSCTNEQPCFPIEVLSNDTLRSHMPGKCMEFIRSSAICGSGETSLLTNKVHQREQINQLTAYIDASNVYGSNDQDAFDIRERVVNSGKLKAHVTSKYPKGLLPFNLDTNMDCQRDNTSTVGCFLAGDYRANEQLALLAMHNLWVRQHNTLVEKLKKINPHWSPEQLFQEARKIVGAQMQVITFEHWLPHILGPVGMEMLGTYKGYDENVDPTIANEFATAAFRFGHALIQPFTFRLNESLQPIEEGNILLRDSFFAPQRYYYEGGMEPLLRGLYGVPAKLKQPREIMNSELTEKLFHITRFVSLDLAALNIQRGRDHGLPGYAAYRKYCKLPDVKNFEDLKNEISSREVREILRKLYGDVRNIDLWPGGILEDPIENSKLGPLFMCIIVEQMKSVRDGDRFWYENDGVFTHEQLNEIKKTSLAKIICENSDNINMIQQDPFVRTIYSNQMIKCSQIEDVSLEPWRNCCKENTEGLCAEQSYFYVPQESERFKRTLKKRN